ncbi:MAG: hypothetical protein V4542_11780 [Pseudomonadota bacterium]
MGNPLQESTPDAGTSTTSYNSLGLPQTVIDSLGQASTLTYDMLGRPTQIRFADGKTTTLAYDLTGSTYNAPGAPNASLGYLSKIEDRSGSTSYQRDIFGRVVQKTQTLPNSSTQQVTYSFTATGLAGTTTYPSGNQLTPAYNSAGQLTTLTWNGTPLITNLQWTPLGQPGTWTWAFSNSGGTDMAGRRGYDTAGRVTATELNTYGYDAAGRISGITQQLYAPTDTNPSNSGITQTTASWTAGYDATGRLTGFIESTALTTTTGPGTASFSYDSNGNRLSSLQTATAGTSTSSTARSYAVTAGTNRLLGYGQSTTTNLGSSTSTVSYTYNAAGDITNQGSKTFSFNAESRLSSMATGTTGTSPTTYYTHNASGQRGLKLSRLQEHRRQAILALRLFMTKIQTCWVSTALVDRLVQETLNTSGCLRPTALCRLLRSSTAVCLPSTQTT